MPIELITPPGAAEESIHIAYFDHGKPGNVVLVVGGSGDTRGTLSDFARELGEARPDHDVATFSFRGRETQRPHKLSQQVQDLRDVLAYLHSQGKHTTTIICTSQGAFSTCHLLASADGAKMRKVIFLDPADHELEPDVDASAATTHSGHQDTPFAHATAASLLKNLKSDCIINVIHLSIRNYTPQGSVTRKERGIDHPGLYPRLSATMIKAFYTHTPQQNRGQYLEMPDVPHAFNRGGNKPQNIAKLIAIIAPLL